MDYSARKGQANIRLIDAEGSPVADKKVEVQMTRHAFLFGCGAFDFVDYCNLPEGEEDPALQDRIDKWLDLYNYGTLPFYWGRFEPEEGKPQTAKLMKTAQYLKNKGVELKGHPLCWHTVCADWLLKYDNETILQKQIDRIHRDVGQFKGLIDRWDVINEVVIMPIFDKYDNAITRLAKDLGRVGIVKQMFEAAYETNPGAELLINDFNTSTNYEILIDGCLNAGVPISAIGIQSHQHQGYWGAEKLEAVLERFEHFGLPIHFTENTLISGDLMPEYIVDLNDWQVPEWPSTVEGEERQMQEVEEMYRILFNHPLVEAITGWDFTDGAWLGAPSGVLREDNSVKPVYKRLKELIKQEWWTTFESQSDTDGQIRVEGFKGDYELLIDGKAYPFTLASAKDGAEDPIVIRLS
jgi:endo-1,4-beta-xylanase